MKRKINERDLFRLDERLSDLLNADIEARTDYSGRGMYGATCVGWVHDQGSVEFGVALAAALIGLRQDFGEQEDDDHLFNVADPEGDLSDLVGFASSGREDNMGWSTITYFPGLEFEQPFKQPIDHDEVPEEARTS